MGFTTPKMVAMGFLVLYSVCVPNIFLCLEPAPGITERGEPCKVLFIQLGYLENFGSVG